MPAPPADSAVASDGGAHALPEHDASQEPVREASASSDAGGESGPHVMPSACKTANHAAISHLPAIQQAARAAHSFRASLEDKQYQQAFYCLESDQLKTWNFLPVWVAPRKGLEFSQLNAQQRQLVYVMIDGFLSARGAQRVDLIINTLDEAMKMAWNGFGFGSDKYRVTLFNEPMGDGSWGVRLEGHHLSLTFVVDGDHVACTPAFFGAQPKVVKDMPLFDAEESAALSFVSALSSDHLKQALIGASAPADILSSNAEHVDDTLFAGKGLSAKSLTSAESEKLRALIAQAVSYQADGFAAETMARVDASLAEAWFAWMGPSDGSGRYYFRVFSPAILIEYDLTALLALGSAGDHPHLVIRTPDGGDYGAFAALTPSLLEHLRTAAHHRRDTGLAVEALAAVGTRGRGVLLAQRLSSIVEAARVQ